MNKTKEQEFPLDELARLHRLIDIGNAAYRVVGDKESKSMTWIQYSIKLWLKLLIHGKSMCLLSADTIFESQKSKEEPNEFYDLSGIFSNVRSQIDCYSTIYHLYFANVDMEVKRLRFDLWRYDSLCTLEVFKPKRLIEVRNQKDEISAAIKGNNYFLSLPSKYRKKLLDEQKSKANWKFDPSSLDKKGNVRSSWENMFLRTGVKTEILDNVHRYLSTHVHSDYISVYMMATMTKAESHRHKQYAILLSSFVQCFAIDDFGTRFPEIRDYVENLGRLEKETILSFLKNGRDEHWISSVKYGAT